MSDNDEKRFKLMLRKTRGEKLSRLEESMLTLLNTFHETTLSRPITRTAQESKDVETVKEALGLDLSRTPPPTGDGCFTCKFLLFSPDSWEMPHLGELECTARPEVANLKGWPWKTTKCAKRKKR